jgi:hypothetical protein
MAGMGKSRRPRAGSNAGETGSAYVEFLLHEIVANPLEPPALILVRMAKSQHSVDHLDRAMILDAKTLEASQNDRLVIHALGVTNKVPKDRGFHHRGQPGTAKDGANPAGISSGMRLPSFHLPPLGDLEPLDLRTVHDHPPIVPQRLGV